MIDLAFSDATDADLVANPRIEADRIKCAGAASRMLAHFNAAVPKDVPPAVLRSSTKVHFLCDNTDVYAHVDPLMNPGASDSEWQATLTVEGTPERIAAVLVALAAHAKYTHSSDHTLQHPR